MTLHNFQLCAIDSVFAELTANRRYIPVVAPTGTGKSYIATEIQSRLLENESNFPWIITPKLEIIAGFLKKRGWDSHNMTEDQLIDIGWSCRIATPVRLKNRLLCGHDIPLTHLIFDELHHHEADTYQIIDMMTQVPCIGLTATYFRGTPKSTALLRERWGPPITAISYPEAVQQQYIQMPVCRTEPLVDDDIIEIQNGEFQIESLESSTIDRLDDSIRLFGGFVNDHGKIDTPTMVSLPSRRLVSILESRLWNVRIPCNSVTQETSSEQRQYNFQACIQCRAILLQIDVVSEGVDLPIKRLVDMRPTLSPVKWQQQIGRIMRPGGAQPEYICTNRNLMRHAYLLEGLVPINAIKESQEVFPPSQRAGMRAVGLESIGRFKPVFIKTESGLTCTMYNLVNSNENSIDQWAVILHPCIPEPLIAKKVSGKKEDGSVDWGKWARVDMPKELLGFQSAAAKILTSPQRKKWTQCASWCGLDETQTVDTKNIQALFVCLDTKTKLP